MARFYGNVGYSETIETSPGVYTEQPVEYPYYGDIEKDTITLKNGQYLNSDISVGNSISIIADAYAYEHFYAIKYVNWAGTNWSVSTVTVNSPRLVLRLGGVYNGPTA